MELLDFVAGKFHEEGGVFKLLVRYEKYTFLGLRKWFYLISWPWKINFPQIIDSIMALFRVDFSGRGELAERQQKLAQMLSRLQKISEGLENHLLNIFMRIKIAHVMDLTLKRC